MNPYHPCRTDDQHPYRTIDDQHSVKISLSKLKLFRHQYVNFTSSVCLLITMIILTTCATRTFGYKETIPNMEVFVAQDNKTLMFNVVVHKETGEVFVGARNAIYKFDHYFNMTERAVTGPRMDSLQCAPPPAPCDPKYARKLTDNDNKILLIIYDNSPNLLLSCGSVYQGMCTLQQTNNISKMIWIGDEEETTSYVAGKNSAFAFYAPYPGGKTMALYSASTYDGRPLNMTPRAVSSRVLKKGQKNGDVHFEYAVQTDVSVTSIDFSAPSYKRSYKVTYLYGFTYGNFSYFVTNQRVSLKKPTWETRLVRVCNNDERFFSYMEVPIKCERATNVYNLATAAYLGPAGPTLKRTLRLDQAEDVLYVAFGLAKQDKRLDTRSGTVVCSFPMSSIITSFTTVIRDCFNAENGSRRLKVFTVNSSDVCVRKTDIEIDDDFCGSAFNRFIEGPGAIAGGLRIHTNEMISALAVTLQNTKTVAVLGTQGGKVMKIYLDRQNEQQLYSWQIASGKNQIHPSLAFDKAHDNIYLLAENKVVKFPIGSCTPYTKCRSCVTTEDPLDCHWCGTHCAHYHECGNVSTFQREACPPIVYEFSPRYGPLEGGTELTIQGDNFGSNKSGPGVKITINVGDKECLIKEWTNERVRCLTASSNTTQTVKVNIWTEDPGMSDEPFDTRGNTTSDMEFSYVMPVIKKIWPNHGPASGGTHVIIEGENLDVGTNCAVFLAGVECSKKSIRSNGKFIECVSGQHSDYGKEEEYFERVGPVEVHIDGAKLYIKDTFMTTTVEPGHLQSEFHYLEDPVINKVSPQVATISGGTVLTVEGLHLRSVAQPRLSVTATSSVSGKQVTLEQDCMFGDEEGTRMTCLVPSLYNMSLHPLPSPSVPLQAHIGFIMDGVKALKNLTYYNPKLSQLLYYPDPEFYPFKGEEKRLEVVKNDLLVVLKGKNLNLALRPEDINIIVQTFGECSIIDLTSDTLRCQLPTVDGFEEIQNQNFSLMLRAGHLSYDLGVIAFVDKPSSMTTGPVTAIIIPVFIIILILVILFLYIRYRRKWQRKKPSNMAVSYSATGRMTDVQPARCRQEANDYQTFNPGDRDNQQPLLPSHQVAQNQIDSETMQLLHAENILIAREYLVLEEVIGQGHFGCVHKGVLQLPGKDNVVSVAVKTLNSNVSKMEQDVEAFLQEGLMMKDFHHHNVLTLIGVSFEANNTPLVIIPFMANGDLLSYIRNENNSPTVKDLLTFGVQVAEGMKYLSDLKFVHRDLAARNCMLDEDLTVKVADFGLSRDIYEREYYSSDNKKTKLPVKWMAPESLEKGTYSSKTDVWSYGVLLWELMTRGVTPYPDVDNWDILHYLKQGRRMPQPSYCPDMLYKVMLQCWNEDPKKRPLFSELADDVQGVITKLEQKSKQRRVGLDVTYVNYPPPDSGAEQV